ncbi:sulfate anion transporter [Pluteus cervinus]|uniref:Sulfate anion transporter n=1 Tax=Pluteus cervinus TaxID=181527 RepID=A0ACD3B9C9_9AGAR|nr:sulfate anion transporter [Pluteus cervinus]
MSTSSQPSHALSWQEALNTAPSTPSTTSLMGVDAIIPPAQPSSSERATLLDVESVAGQYGSSSISGQRVRKPSKLAKRIKYYVPSTAWIPNYSMSLLGGDFLAGLTVACMLIPQSVSYATSLAHLSPVTGLFSASIPGIIYALLGTSRQLNVAPEAALSLLIGQVVADVLRDAEGNPEVVALEVATITTLQAGIISFMLGFVRLGFMDVVLSRALLQGFVTAVAVVIMIEQLIPMFGLTALAKELDPEGSVQKAGFLIEYALTHMHRPTAIVSFSALGALVVLRMIKARYKQYWFIYRLPEVLIVVLVSTYLSAKYHWDEDGLSILGPVSIKTSGSFIKLPFSSDNLPYLHRTTSTAILISVMGFLDSIVAAKQNGARFGHSISPNRELVALGAANIGASFVPGTLPAYGSITRSRMNGDCGGRTQMASLISSAFILLTTFFLLPWLYYLPRCVLAAIICLVVFSLLAEAPHGVIYYLQMEAWVDLSLMFLTFFLSVVWHLETGVVVSLVISLLLVVHRSSKPRMTILGRIPGTDQWKAINENPDAQEDTCGALIVRIKENLDFANTAQLKERLRRLELYGIERSHPSEEPRRQQATALVFHMADVDSIDASAAQIFHELIEEYRARGVGLYVTHLHQGPRQMFAKAGIIKLLGLDAFQPTVADAMAIVEVSR